MTDQELDRIMRRVLLDAIEQKAAEEEENGVPFASSDKHQRQMRAMLADPLRWARRRGRPAWKTALCRVAIVFLVTSLTFLSVMVVSPAARAAVIRWAMELYETHIIYRYTGEQMTGEMPRYEITALPEGFAEAERSIHPASVSVVYMDHAGNTICMDYTFMQQGAATMVVPEDDAATEIFVHTMPGTLFRSDIPGDMHTIIWFDGEANIKFTIDAALSEMDILHIAESVSLVKTDK